MRKSWPTSRLGDVATIQTGFPFKSADFIGEAPGAVRLLRGDNIVQKSLRWSGAKHLPPRHQDDDPAYRLEPGDLVLAMDRPWIEAGLKVAVLGATDLPALLVQRVARLRGGSRIDQDFLKWVLYHDAFAAYLQSVQTGTAVPHISGVQIANYTFGLPPVDQQREIAGVLQSLDDLIETNRPLVIGVEAAVSAAFAGLMSVSDCPARRPVEELCFIRGGSTPRTSVASYWEGGTISWATPKDLSRLPSTPLLGTDRQITEAGLGQISSGLLPAGTLLMSSRAPVGYLAIAEVPVAVNQGFIAMVCDMGVSNYFLWQWLRANMDQVLARANGSTFQEISKANFRPMLIDVPSAAALAAFDRAVEPLYRAIVELELEIASLQRARDELLPLLMSGRVVPSEIAS